MADIDHEKDLAALQLFEREKERRLQTRIDSGEVLVQTITVVVHPCEDEEEATARAVARHPAPDDGREVHREFFYISTGVPRPDPDFGKPSPQVQTASEEEPPRPSEEPAASGTPIPCSQPIYVRVTIRNGDDDGDPGAIAEAYYTIDDGAVVLRDADDKHLTSRALLKGQDPAAVARALLREVEEPKSFNHPIHYPKLGLA